MTDAKPIIECARCVAPGMCCKAFPLNHFWPVGTSPDTVAAWLAEKGYPFEPLRRYMQWNGQHTWQEQWLHRCTKLGADGRCTIYDDRPELCRTYEPGMDMMCVHMRGLDGQPLVPQLAVAES